MRALYTSMPLQKVQYLCNSPITKSPSKYCIQEPNSEKKKKKIFPFAPFPNPCTSMGSFHNCDKAVLPVLTAKAALQHKEPFIIASVLNFSWLKKTTELLRQQQVSKAVNGNLYGCKVKQRSCKRKIKPLHLKNASRKFYILFALCYLTGLLFFPVASSPKLQVVSINFRSRPGVCQQPVAPAEPLLHDEEPTDPGGAPAAALWAADRRQPIQQAWRADWKKKHLHQCQPSHQGARA